MKYLATEKVNHSQIYLLLRLVICCNYHQLNLPKYWKSRIVHLMNFSIYCHCSYWQLTEVMRQKCDKTFVCLLNNIGVGDCSEDNLKQLQLRKIDLNSVPLDATVILAKNKPNKYNACKSSQLNHFEIKVEAINSFPDTMLIHLQTSHS